MSKNNKEKNIIIKVGDMSCAACSQRIENNLNKSNGIDRATVNLATENAQISFNEDHISIKEIGKIIEETGYTVKSAKLKLKIDDMSCAACAQKVENVLNDSEGVINANVNIANDIATIEYLGDFERDYFINIIENTGYSVKKEIENNQNSVEKEDEENDLKLKIAKRKMLWSWAITIPIIMWMIPEMVFNVAFPNMTIYKIGMILLATPIMFIIGKKTYIMAYRSVKHGGANMDVLIAMGTIAAYITGPISFFVSVESYAGVSGMIMTFHLTGKYIEERAKGKASKAIKKLLELGAKTAFIEKNGEVVEVPIEEVKVDDVMIVKPGSKIPTDGIIVEGKTSIDESMATGESMPVIKNKSDEVIGGTINQKGSIKVRATKIGKDTFLSQVIKMVEEAQGTKVPIQAFADKVTSIFVPTVLVIATLTFLSWLIIPDFYSKITIVAADYIPWVKPELGTFTSAIFATVAVLVIACPCALGLATPTALMVGTGMGAENGVLIRKGQAIQILKEIHTIVFDKTGTITKGSPEVTDVVSFSDIDFLGFAASLEKSSEHPLGEAIVNYSNEEKKELKKVSDFNSITGKGVVGFIENKKVLVGNRKLMNDEKIDISFSEEKMVKLEKEAKTAMLVAIDNDLVGIIAVADPIKDDSIKAIEGLRQLGLETVMITGDNEHTAKAIAKKVGIDHVVSEVLPEGKVREIKELQNKYGVIAMVGDGINDAPALTQADVGIAIGTGTDIAIESADVTIVQGKLSSVITAVKLSRATFKKIKQNLFWAFFYNLIMIPVAITGLMHPLIAESAMAFSSISVVTNANLLRRADIGTK